MDKDFYNKISIAYQNLSDRFHSLDKRFNNGYVEYNIKLSLFTNDKLDFYKQFQEVPMTTFYQNDFISSYHYKSFYETDCIIIKEDIVKVHMEFYMILFYYLINEFKVGIKQFLYILDSGVLDEHYHNRIENDEHYFKYNNTVSEEIFQYFHSKIENFGFIFHLFTKTNSSVIYINTKGKIEINKRLINEFLHTTETVFNFDKFKIK